MNISTICIYVGGSLTFLMALFHTRFYKLFRWNIDFKKINATNKRVFYTIHVALYLLFFGFSFLTFFYASQLSTSKGISLGINVILSLFWLWRTGWQILYFKPDKKSKFLIMHYILIIVFFLLFLSYTVPIVYRLV